MVDCPNAVLPNRCGYFNTLSVRNTGSYSRVDSIEETTDEFQGADYRAYSRILDMIAEFLQLSGALRERGVVVGRAIIGWKHFAVRSAKVIFMEPEIRNIYSDYVDLVLGTLDDKPMFVRVPTPLFEAGNIGDIRTWVTQQNNLFDTETEVIQNEQSAKEVELLKRLKSKYPGV